MKAWLGRNWEPITAVCAMMVSIASFFLAISAHWLADRDSKIGRAPLLSINMNSLEGTLSVTNVGNGPAVIYQAALAVGERSYPIVDPADGKPITSAVVDAVTAVVGEEAAAFGDFLIEYTTPGTILGVGDRLVVFRLSKELREAAGLGAIEAALSSIGGSFCFTDVLGDMRGFRIDPWKPGATFSDYCADPPKVLLF